MSERAMRWASALSTAPRLDDAVAAAADMLTERLGAAPDLALAFVSAHHAPGYDRLPELVATRLAPRAFVGCSAGGVIGDGREVEQGAAVSLTGALLPGARVRTCHVAGDDLAAASAERWHDLAGGETDDASFVVLADPFTVDGEALVRGLDGVFPRAAKVGGVASGGEHAGATVLFDGDAHHRTGVVAAAITGAVDVATIVAQGCRPIGEPMFVTGAQRHVLRELDGRPAMRVLRELHGRLAPRDRQLAQHSLFAGVALRDTGQEYHQGDFLIRNIVGIDAATGALAVAAELRDGMVFQFHLRDAATSTADLDALLERYARRTDEAPAGGLLFSCLGRGMHLYGRANHDTDLVRKHLGPLPLGGFFCNGEIGPVDGRTFVHGYTSAFALFRPRPT